MHFERPEDARAFVAEHGGTVNEERPREKWWAQLDLDVEAGDFDGVFDRAGAYGAEGHQVRFWPTRALDTPLREQVDVLFEDRGSLPIHFGFFPTGAGWGRVVVATRSASTDHRASYYAYDTLGDLARFGLAVLRGDAAAATSFWDEPGELRVTASGEGDVIAVEVRTGGGDYYSGPGEGELALELSTRCARRELATAIVRCLDHTLERYGAETFGALWRMTAFPSEAHAELRRVLGESAVTAAH
jgi:hypothetical protein